MKKYIREKRAKYREAKDAIMDKINPFLCFFKQISVLFKNTIGKKSVNGAEYHDLAPVDDVRDCEEHLKALQWAVENPKIRNIALTGPYGSGKSSIINTFLTKNPVLDSESIKVSLATFDDVANNKPIDLNENLVDGILQQLFYKVEQGDIPQSRYRKLYKVHYLPFALILTGILLISSLFCFIFFPTWFQEKCDLIIQAGAAFNLSKPVSLGVFICVVWCISLYFASILRRFYSRFNIRELSLSGKATVGTDGADEHSILNKKLDEIIYFFEETGYRIIFFEDLDRFNKPSVFIQLRELNTLLNNYNAITKPIVFVYAVKDDMFTSTERTKFFDFIIPVIPVINSTNSYEAFLALLKESKSKGIVHDISDHYVKDVSPYISDMRVLYNIFNEFLVYKATIKEKQNLTLHDEAIMSLIIYKNLFPKDFSELQSERGLIKRAFSDKEKFIGIQQDQYAEEIQEKTGILEGISQDILHSVNELKYSFLCSLTAWNGLPYSIRYNYYNSISASAILDDSFDFSKITGKGPWDISYYHPNGSSRTISINNLDQLVEDFLQRKKYLQTAEENGVDRIKEEIADIEAKRNVLSTLSLADILREYKDIDQIFSDQVCNNDLLVFMLRRGYIDEKYSFYINFFKPNSITTDDMNFILCVRNQKPLPAEYSLTKLSEIIERLHIHEFGEKSILNYKLVDYLFSHSGYDEQIQTLLHQLSDGTKECWSFVKEYSSTGVNPEKFIQSLSMVNSQLWDSVYMDTVLTYDRKIQYLELILSNADSEVFRQQDQHGNLSKFFVENVDILQKINSKYCSQIIDMIGTLNICFSKIVISGVSATVLDYIFQNRRYCLNRDMINAVIEYINPALLANSYRCNYSTVTELNYSPLTEYIQDNIIPYIQDIVLAKENTSETIPSIEDLIIRTVTDDPKLSEAIIQHQIFVVDCIHEFCYGLHEKAPEQMISVWNLLLKYNKVTPTWENIKEYYDNSELSDELTDYISRHSKELSVADSKCLDDEVKRDLLLADLDRHDFIAILPCLYLEELSIPLSELEKEKLLAMIQTGYLEFTPEHYAEVNTVAPELCSVYILHNQHEYAQDIDSINISSTTFENLVISENVEKTIVEKVISRHSNDLMTEKAAKHICEGDFSINRKTFLIVWELIESVFSKKSFLFKHLEILSCEDMEKIFQEIGYPYDRLIRKSSRHDEFLPNTPENTALVKRLEVIQLITSYDVETQQVFSGQEKKRIEVIRARVKTKSDSRSSLSKV